MTWSKSYEAQKFFVECFWRKMSQSATREVETMSEITAVISRMPTREKSLSKTLDKNYSFLADNIFKLAQLNRKEPWTRKGCPWIFFLMTWRASLWHCNRTQIASDCARRSDSKTHQRLAGRTLNGIPARNNDLWNIFFCVKALGWDECGGSCVVNTSLRSTFLEFLEWRYGGFVKTNFYIIWIDIVLL